MSELYTVSFVLPFGLILGGMSTWSLQMAKYLHAEHCSASLIEHECIDWHPRLNIRLPEGVTHIHCHGATITQAKLRDVKAYVRTYASVLPAVFVVNYSAPAFAVCARLIQQYPDQLRVIGMVHGDTEDNYSFLRYYESSISKFIAVNSTMATKLCDMLPHRCDDIVAKACPVDVPGKFIEKVFTHTRPLRLVYVGRITNWQKRVSELVPLIVSLDRQGVSFELRIVGDGGYKDTLISEIASLNESLQRCVTFVDTVPPAGMSAVWRWADFVVLVSDSESSGMTLQEGMAYGCIPVSTKCSGPESYIKDGVNGVLVNIGDMNAMALRICELSCSLQRMNEMSCRSRKTVESIFSYENYTPWFLSRCDEAWSNSSGTWPLKKRLLQRENTIMGRAFIRLLHRNG